MASLPLKDCTTPLEDFRLLYSKDYMRLVSSGIGDMGIDRPIMIGPYSGMTLTRPRLPPRTPPIPSIPTTRNGPWKIANPIPAFPLLNGLEGKTQDIPVTQWGYGGWPPGPQPHPHQWTEPRSGITWTRTVLDGKWLYQSSQDERYYITASNLYELQGLRKDTDGLIVDKPKGSAAPENWWEKKFFGVQVGWLAALAVGGYVLTRKGR